MLSATSPGLGVSGVWGGMGRLGTFTARGRALDGWGEGCSNRRRSVPPATYPLHVPLAADGGGCAGKRGRGASALSHGCCRDGWALIQKAPGVFQSALRASP